MDVQISPAPQFNGGNDQSKMIVPSAYQPLLNGPKCGLAFQCMVCNETFDDPTLRYEHMTSQHGDLCGNGFDCDSDDEISDDLTRLLEPICEIKLIGEDGGELHNHLANVPVNSFGNNGQQVTGEQLGLQIGLHVQMQLQLALQQHLMQAQMNGTRQFAQPPMPPPMPPQSPLQPQTQPLPQLQPNQNIQMQTTNGNQNQPAPLPTRKIFIFHLFDLVAKCLIFSNCSNSPGTWSRTWPQGS